MGNVRHSGKKRKRNRKGAQAFRVLDIRNASKLEPLERAMLLVSYGEVKVDKHGRVLARGRGVVPRILTHADSMRHHGPRADPSDRPETASERKKREDKEKAKAKKYANYMAAIKDGRRGWHRVEDDDGRTVDVLATTPYVIRDIGPMKYEHGALRVPLAKDPKSGALSFTRDKKQSARRFEVVIVDEDNDTEEFWFETAALTPRAVRKQVDFAVGIGKDPAKVGREGRARVFKMRKFGGRQNTMMPVVNRPSNGGDIRTYPVCERIASYTVASIEYNAKAARIGRKDSTESYVPQTDEVQLPGRKRSGGYPYPGHRHE